MLSGSVANTGERGVVGPDNGQTALPARRVPKAPRKRRSGAEHSPARAPAGQPAAPPVREEYPGPQTSSDGEHIEPGQTRPSPTAPSKR